MLKVFFMEQFFTRESVPVAKRYSASEIADMALPGLPKTKARVIERAAQEAWPYEEVKARGGTRRLYDVPEKYLEGPGSPATSTAISHPVAGTVVAGTGKVDIRKLELAMKALNEWEQTRGLTVAQERRPAVVAVLYDYLVKSEGESSDEIAVVLRALG